MARHDARRPLRLDHRSSCLTPLPTSMRWLDATSAIGRLKRTNPTDTNRFGQEQARRWHNVMCRTAPRPPIPITMSQSRTATSGRTGTALIEI